MKTILPAKRKKIIQNILLPTVVLISILFSFNMTNQLIHLNKSNEEKIELYFDEMNREVNTMIYSTIKRDADYKTNKFALELREKLIEEYGDDTDRFIRDYDSTEEDTTLVKILNESLEDSENRFFYVKNDNNDVYMISQKEVLADKSTTTSTVEGIRTLDGEAKKHPNKRLAKQVFKKIIEGNNENLFIQTSNRNGVIDLESHEINKIMSMDIKDTSDFEFLSVSYIDQYGDIIGTQDVDFKGKKQNSRKIIVVQSFNLWDQANDLRLIKNYNCIQNNENKILTNQQIEREYTSMIGILLTLVFILSFVSMAFLKNRYIKERDKIEY